MPPSYSGDWKGCILLLSWSLVASILSFRMTYYKSPSPTLSFIIIFIIIIIITKVQRKNICYQNYCLITFSSRIRCVKWHFSWSLSCGKKNLKFDPVRGRTSCFLTWVTSHFVPFSANTFQQNWPRNCKSLVYSCTYCD